MFKESIQDLSKKTFYHGSELKVEEFKIQPPSPEHPIYVTSDKKYAESYTGANGGVYAIMMSNKANIFDPDNSSDVEKVKRIFPQLIRIVWFGERLDWKHKKIATKDLMHVSLELSPTPEATYGNADDERLEGGGVVDLLIDADVFDKEEAEEAIDELDAWLDKFGFDYDMSAGTGYFNQIRTIILKILDKLGYMAYAGVEDNGIVAIPAEIYGIFNIDAIAKMSAKPIEK